MTSHKRTPAPASSAPAPNKPGLTREQISDMRIKPLVNKIRDLCKIHGIPFVYAFQLEECPPGETVTHAFCGYIPAHFPASETIRQMAYAADPSAFEAWQLGEYEGGDPDAE